VEKVTQELVRIKLFNKLLDTVGQQEHLYEIFVDATEELLAQISTAIESGSRDDSFLLEAFNHEYNSNAIITHFRVSFPATLLVHHPTPSLPVRETTGSLWLIAVG
jgi:ubiquitin thioesterase protein OTUB1